MYLHSMKSNVIVYRDEMLSHNITLYLQFVASGVISVQDEADVFCGSPSAQLVYDEAEN